MKRIRTLCILLCLFTSTGCTNAINGALLGSVAGAIAYSDIPIAGVFIGGVAGAFMGNTIDIGAPRPGRNIRGGCDGCN